MLYTTIIAYVYYLKQYRNYIFKDHATGNYSWLIWSFGWRRNILLGVQYQIRDMYTSSTTILRNSDVAWEIHPRFNENVWQCIVLVQRG